MASTVSTPLLSAVSTLVTNEMVTDTPPNSWEESSSDHGELDYFDAAPRATPVRLVKPSAQRVSGDHVFYQYGNSPNSSLHDWEEYNEHMSSKIHLDPSYASIGFRVLPARELEHSRRARPGNPVARYLLEEGNLSLLYIPALEDYFDIEKLYDNRHETFSLDSRVGDDGALKPREVNLCMLSSESSFVLYKRPCAEKNQE